MTNPEFHPHQESVSNKPYRQHVEETIFSKFRLDYLKYDRDGRLNYYGVPLVDIAESLGTPLEITVPDIATKKAQWWTETSKKIARSVGFTGKMDYYYASKAAFGAEISAAVIKSGWNIEISSEQDIFNIKWMLDHDMLPENVKIVCNGYKWSPDRINTPVTGSTRRNSNILYEGDWRKTVRNEGHTYAEMALNLRQQGLDVTWIIDSRDELEYLGQSGKVTGPHISAVRPFDVGVRLNSYGVHHTHGDFAGNVNRHGMNVSEIQEVADKISMMPHLRLTTFHAMIGAADSIPQDEHVAYLLQAAETFFELRKKYPTLNKFNMGGGIPPRYMQYDHEAFMRKILRGMEAMAKRYGQSSPEVDFEFGSFVADEATGALMQVVNQKVNNRELDGTVIPWLTVNYSFMRGIIDQILIGKKYQILAANNANLPSRLYRVGDPTCDSDGYFRTDSKSLNTVVLPDQDKITETQYLFIPGIGAYEEQLTGIDGVGHCQLAEPQDVIITFKDGKIIAYVMEFKDHLRVRQVLGYNKGFLQTLQRILGK